MAVTRTVLHPTHTSRASFLDNPTAFSLDLLTVRLSSAFSDLHSLSIRHSYADLHIESRHSRGLFPRFLRFLRLMF